MKSRIVIDIDHHEATKALPRLLQLVDIAGDGYGVADLTYTVIHNPPKES